MKNLLKLTCVETEKTILIGSQQIIEVKLGVLHAGDSEYRCTIIKSVGAMVTTNYVMETLEQIYKQDNDE